MTRGARAPCADQETRTCSLVSLTIAEVSTGRLVSSAMRKRSIRFPVVRIGFQLWPQNTTWPAMREAAQLADRIGIDSVWTWDHFYALSGEEERPNFEAWTILAGFAAVTQRVRLGAMVSGITYRHPAVLANMAATLDQISNGRAIC